MLERISLYFSQAEVSWEGWIFGGLGVIFVVFAFKSKIVLPKVEQCGKIES